MVYYYYLMHKDVDVAILEFSDTYEEVLKVKSINPEYSPFLGNFTLENAKHWWKYRGIASSREDILKLLKEHECRNASEFMVKNHSLSLSDCYWVRGLNEDIKWSEINLYNNADNSISLASSSLFSPNATLNGQMKKTWLRDRSCVYLKKESSVAYGQQNVNEVIASRFHYAQGKDRSSYVPYSTICEDGVCVASICPAVSDINTELVSAYEVINSVKVQNSVSNYEALIQIAVEHGLNDLEVRQFLDYVILSDFILDNSDRHLNNIAFLRDSNSLKFTGICPIYDTGNSMYWNTYVMLSRREHLARHISSLANSYEKILKYPTLDVINYSKLLSNKEVYCIMASNFIPDERIELILNNYEQRKILFSEYQNGLKLSSYKEFKGIRPRKKSLSLLCSS